MPDYDKASISNVLDQANKTLLLESDLPTANNQYQNVKYEIEQCTTHPFVVVSARAASVTVIPIWLFIIAIIFGIIWYRKHKKQKQISS